MIRLNARRSMILVVFILGGFFVVSFAFLNMQGNTGALPSRPQASVTPENTSGPAVKEAEAAGIVAPIEATVIAVGSALAGAPPVSVSTDTGGNPSVEIKKFQRSESKNGKLAWELAGSSARYELGGAEVEIIDAVVKSRLSNGTLATLETPDAKILMSGATLSEAQGTNGVTITLDTGVTVKTETAKFDRNTGKVESPTQITILHPQGSLTANSFSGDTARGKFVFVGNVQTTILPKDKK